MSASSGYFDFIPGGQNGLGHILSFYSTSNALYVAAVSSDGSDAQKSLGVILKNFGLQCS